MEQSTALQSESLLLHEFNHKQIYGFWDYHSWNTDVERSTELGSTGTMHKKQPCVMNCSKYEAAMELD